MSSLLVLVQFCQWHFASAWATGSWSVVIFVPYIYSIFFVHVEARAHHCPLFFCVGSGHLLSETLYIIWLNYTQLLPNWVMLHTYTHAGNHHCYTFIMKSREELMLHFIQLKSLLLYEEISEQATGTWIRKLSSIVHHEHCSLHNAGDIPAVVYLFRYPAELTCLL